MLGACASEADETVEAGPSASQGPGAAPAGVGVVTVQLEPVEGVFIEGFEVGLRFETGDGEVLGSTLWTDYVKDELANPSMDDWYDSVLRQEVPAGVVVVLATVNIGAGPPPEIPDVTGTLRCRLSVEVPTDGEVAVEVTFDEGDGCLRELRPRRDAPEPTTTTASASVATAEAERLIQSFLRFAARPDADSAALVPFAEEVALGLGDALQARRSRAELGDAGAWSIEPDGEEYFRAHTGPFSALELAADARDVVVSVGPHPHCAAPPMPAPAEVTGLRRVSVQPSPGSIDSCLSWWTVDLFLTPEGEVAAVTLDIWEP
jgi:hypothetical protein